jgi:DNA-binding NarL/FixJ family response regulator
VEGATLSTARSTLVPTSPLAQRAQTRWPPGHQTREGDFPAIRVLVACSQTLVRAGLCALLDSESDIVVAAEAAAGDKAVALASEVHPDVVLMNVRLPGLDGLAATRRIVARRELSEVQVLLLGEEECDEDLFGGLRAGARGFVIENAEPGELLRAVRVLARGGVPLSPSLARRLVAEFRSQPDPQRSTPGLFDELTIREREVVRLAASGLTNGEIAERLIVSPLTAKTHVSRAMVKLHVRDRAKLVALAYQTGFAQPLGDRRSEDKRQRAEGVAAGARPFVA